MKQPKKLTREQKQIVSNHCLNPVNWMLVKETDFYLKIIHKESSNIRNIDKFAKGAIKK